jgi:putative transposase
MPEIVRTIKLRLDMPFDGACRTVCAWTEACNAVSRIAFEHGCVSNAIKLQGLAYQAAKDCGLSAQVAVSCIRHVGSKYAAMRSNGVKPTRPCLFKQQSVILQGGKRGRDVSLRSCGLSVWTIDGRQKAVAFSGPPDLQDKLDNWAFGDGRLSVSSGRVFLTLSFKKQVIEQTAPPAALVGVDRGINVLAAAYDGQRHWLRRGGHTKHVRHRYLRVRGSLQRKKTERPSHSVRRLLQRLSGREKRFMRAVNHELSRSIVDFAKASGCPVIAVERLDSLREKRFRKAQRAEINRWAYAQLLFYIRYKAEELGMSVVEVDPRHTSQGCSRCGHVERSNRKGNLFSCQACGFTHHADIQAAMNIRLRGILLRQTSMRDGLPSCSPEARTNDPGSNPGEVAGKLPALAGSP